MGKRKKAAPATGETTVVDPPDNLAEIVTAADAADAADTPAGWDKVEAGTEVIADIGLSEVQTGDEAPSTAESNAAPLQAIAPAVAAAEAEQDAEALNERAKSGNNSDALKKAFQQVLKDVRQLGTAQGAGSKSLVALAARVTQAALDGVIVPKPVVDSVTIYKAFRQRAADAAGKLAVVDMSEKVLKAQASKLNAFIHLGTVSEQILPHPDDDDPIRDAVDLIERATALHVKLQGGSDEKLRNPKAYDALLDIAREQMDEKRKGIWMHSEEVHTLLVSEDTKREKDGLDLVKSALDTLEKAAKGRPSSESRPERLPIEHESIGHAIGHLLHMLGELDPGFIAAREKEQAAEAEKARKQIEKNKAA